MSKEINIEFDVVFKGQEMYISADTVKRILKVGEDVYGEIIPLFYHCYKKYRANRNYATR
jgi:hypothetical protein